MRNSSKLASLLLIAIADQSAQGKLYELEFWPGKHPRSAPGYVRIADHPCGTVVIARVGSIPIFRKDAPLQSETVYELDARGNVINRWPAPVDSTPAGVKGDRLLLYNVDTSLWVTPSGQIFPSTEKPHVRTVNEVQCRVVPEFKGSEFKVCEKLKDRATGRARIITYQTVCT